MSLWDEWNKETTAQPPLNPVQKSTGGSIWDQWNNQSYSAAPATPSVPAPTALQTGFPATSKTISDLKIDPLNLHANPVRALSDAWDTIKESVTSESKNLQNLLSFKGKTLPQKVNEEFKAGTGAVNIEFSPLSALFKAAEDIPVLGSVTKLITLPFTAVGDAAPHVSNMLIDKLPISQDAKEAIKPGIGEMFTLAAQLALGEGIGKATRSKLIETYGKEDAKTIITKAQELAKEKTQIEQPIESEVKSAPEAPQLATEPIKTAEEFVKAQGTLVYRGEGGSNVAQGKALLAEGKHFASDAEYPKGFGTVSEFVIKPNAKVLDLGDSTFAEISQKLGIPERKYISPKELSTLAKEKGFDVLKYNGEYRSTGKQFSHFVDLTGDSMINKSQLTDLYNQVHTENLSPEKGVSKIGKSIETKTIEKGLTKAFEGTAEYEKINIKDQAERAAKVLGGDRTALENILSGEAEIPQGLRAEALIKATEDYALEKGDAQLLQKLANSPLTAETSVHAQAMRLMAERNPDSVVTKLRELKKAREAAALKKGQTVSKAKKAVVDDIKNTMKKARSKRPTWEEFAKEISCRY